ncbi:MAG: phosphoenolpyruvate-protein phosphotransferase system enzyme [Blastocatellia bacterium]|nr:phosphoenolpyruvate-protein phosphotransferase system enzyme [Blastocatellia bacterium]
MSEIPRLELREKHWQGVSVSDGLIIGKVLRIPSGTRNILRTTLLDADVERETRRLRAAVRLARMQLLAIRNRAERELGMEHAYIFDAHILMLEDKKLLDDVEAYIRRERSNAEWAVKVAADKILGIYAEIKDDYLRQRGSDIEDVTRRILAALSGEDPAYSKLEEDAVIVAEDFLPSAVAELDFRRTLAIVTDAGGWTSHTSILARGLGIPAVVGLRDLHRHVKTGDEIIVDGSTGDVYLHPNAATLNRYKTAAAVASANLSFVDDARGAVSTTDGIKIILQANVELPAEYDGVLKYGAMGIGLYRSEFLFAQRVDLPSEEMQRAAYVEVGKFGGEKGATIRLFDLGGDKIGLAETETERNPALGLRALRFGLRHIDVLRTQVRAILRAAAEVKLSLVLPMVSDVSDVRRARRIIDEERTRLAVDGRKQYGEIKIGAMIEIPSAVMTVGSIAAEVDFLSLGTNDLVQYLLAVDRGNEAVAEWFRTLHPAVLQSISQVLAASKLADIPVSVCGEMAGTPAYAVVLLGLGVRRLSMTPSLIPRMRSVLGKVSLKDAEQIANECLSCVEADDVEDLVRAELSKRWGALFPSKSLPIGRSRG